MLVVDDMPMTQFIVTALLSKLHFSCTTMSNGLEAVAEIKKNKYDLILMVLASYSFFLLLFDSF